MVTTPVVLGAVLCFGGQKADRQRIAFQWQHTIPPAFADAVASPVHPVVFKMRHFAFQRTGKVRDFFREMVRPDLFSRQGFTSATHVVAHPSGWPLYGSFKYRYQDGIELYMTTGKMEWVDLALLYKNGKLVRLMYK
jgi:hypothetical protein